MNTSLVVQKILTIGVMIIIAMITMIIIKLAIRGKKAEAKDTPIVATKSVITMNEQPLFSKLKETLNDCHILAQVAMSALITTNSYATRNKFNRERVDFVVLNKNFKVMAIVELDDASHKEMEEKDKKRDERLAEAGYTVIRYKKTPTVEEIKNDFRV